MTTQHSRRWLGAAIAVSALVGLGQLPAVAHPARPALVERHAIAKADSTGPIVVDAHGAGYVTWDRLEPGGGGDAVDFCRIPRGGTCTRPVALPLPSHAVWDDYEIIQPFPVLGGKPDTLLVVGPSYDLDDVVVWTSHNRGRSFGEPQVIPSPSFAGTTGVGDILRSPIEVSPTLNYFSIAGANVGLGYSFTGTGTIGARDPPSGFKLDTDHIPGGVDGSTLGFSGQQTIEAFTTDASRPRVAYFWSPVSGVSGSPGTLEHGPTQVAVGANARLAGGAHGLFLLSSDLRHRASKPLRLDVRKWKRSTHTFGPPTLVGTVPNDINGTNTGGFTEDSDGTLVVAWPGYAAHGQYVMRVWTSTNHGRTFSKPTIVADIGAAYAGPARVAAQGTQGFLTFQDSRGLEVVDLTHL